MEVALRREELSVVDAVLEFEVPLPLPAVSLRGNQAYPQRDQSLMDGKISYRLLLTKPSNIFSSRRGGLGTSDGTFPEATLLNFTAPSKDLLPGCSNTLKED